MGSQLRPAGVQNRGTQADTPEDSTPTLAARLARSRARSFSRCRRRRMVRPSPRCTASGRSRQASQQ